MIAIKKQIQVVLHPFLFLFERERRENYGFSMRSLDQSHKLNHKHGTSLWRMIDTIATPGRRLAQLASSPCPPPPEIEGGQPDWARVLDGWM